MFTRQTLEAYTDAVASDLTQADIEDILMNGNLTDESLLDALSQPPQE